MRNSCPTRKGDLVFSCNQTQEACFGLVSSTTSADHRSHQPRSQGDRQLAIPFSSNSSLFLSSVGMDLEQLPKAWLLRFAELLPNHLKLQLRQCSRSMLELVDGSSNLIVWAGPSAFGNPRSAAVMFDLMHNYVGALVVSALPAAAADCFTSASAAHSVPLPRLLHLRAHMHQHKLLSTIAAATAPRGLNGLVLDCCGMCFLGQAVIGVVQLSPSDAQGLLTAAGEE